jgi:hypothetical protein
MTGIVKIIIDIKKRYSNEIATKILTEEYLESQKVAKVGNEYYIMCKSFNIYINPETKRLSMCIGEAPISTIWLSTIEEYNAIIDILKEEGELLP